MNTEAKQIDISATIEEMRLFHIQQRKRFNLSPQETAAIVAKLDDQAKRIAELSTENTEQQERISGLLDQGKRDYATNGRILAENEKLKARIAELEAGHATTAVMVTVGGAQYGVHVNVANRLRELEAKLTHVETLMTVEVNGREYAVPADVALRLKELEAEKANPWRSMDSVPAAVGIDIVLMSADEGPVLTMTPLTSEEMGAMGWMLVPAFKEPSNG